jgi:signal transduction histidine kinase
MVITLWVALAAVLAATANNLVLGGPLALPLAIGAALIAAMLWLRGRAVNVDAINRAQVLVYLTLFVNGVIHDGIDGVPVTLPYLPNIVLAAALLSGFGLALVAGGVGALLVAGVWLGGQHSFQDSASLMNVLLSVSLMTAVSHSVWNLHSALLVQLHARAEALSESLRQRRRLLGTLFHDINNPLMAIQGILQLPQAGVPLTPRDQERVQHMAGRIHGLVTSAEGYLLVDVNVPSAELKSVDVAQAFADTQELFEARLRVKRQHLSFSSPPDLAVRALPEVLRDSVLSNLVSNALKFSPATAGLSLEAREQGDEVALVVRDNGPGVPQAVIDALATGGIVHSGTGTGGEQGQGLGLGLVQEHLRRLGGRLELERLVGGGTEARAWLKKA